MKILCCGGHNAETAHEGQESTLALPYGNLEKVHSLSDPWISH